MCERYIIIRYYAICFRGDFDLKKYLYFLLCICIVILLTGCGKDNKEEEYFETTLSFDKEGTVTDVIVESFTEDYYSEDGLKAYFQEKISEFNSSNMGKGEVKLENLSVENGKARATLVFDSSDTYTSFYGPVTFYGTISDAYDKGYITETVLKSVNSSDTLSKIDLMRMRKDNIIIVSEVVRVICPSKVTHTSANVEIINDKEVRISSDSTGLAYILVK